MIGICNQVEFDGASRKYKFNRTGESLNLKYSIMNFKEQRQFFEVISCSQEFLEMFILLP